MTQKKNIGDVGENIAAKFLKKKGYKIINRNYSEKWGEIDIIATSKNKTLVFVEVKTVTGPFPKFEAEEQLTKQKIKRLQRTAILYANNNENLSNNGWRIDLLAITIENSFAKIKHYKNI